MNNYKFIISYDGSRYYGWEHQPGIEFTIQGKIENVLAKMVGENVEVLGAGRTDAGVHARGMVANAKFDTNMSEEEIKAYMNRYLPDDIGIVDVRIASDRFHSRYNAVGKTYRYTCYYGANKPIFDRKYVYVLENKPNVEKMREAAQLLIGKNDYASFCGNAKMKKSTVRIVDRVEIDTKDNYIYLTFHGTGFLQHMVRIMTGTLLEVGFGMRTPESMNDVLEAKSRPAAGFTAPPQGLCLIEVDYS